MEHRQKILIVDDEPFNVDYLEQELEELDYEINSAANGQEALDRVYSFSPDLVLLDIMMPVMDGFEVLSRLKADPATRGIPVIIISASNDLRSVVKGIKMGAEDYLPKPFEPTLLLARVSSSLEKKRLLDLQSLYLKGLEREFDIAREIQVDFLPSELPDMEGWEIAAYLKAAREVAGDYYDAFILPNGCLEIVLGDVCGKGVGAALFMTLFRSLIRATSLNDLVFAAGDASLSPVDRLKRVVSFTNHYLTETHGDANMFSTLFLGILDPQTNVFSYANCGNEAPVLMHSDGTTTFLNPTGPAVGVIPEAVFGVREISIGPQDVLLACTDGMTDALNQDNEPFGAVRLIDALKSANRSPVELIRSLKGHLAGFMGQADPFDDITLLALRRSV